MSQTYISKGKLVKDQPVSFKAYDPTKNSSCKNYKQLTISKGKLVYCK